MSHPIRRRRPRAVFHYKVDELLRPGDRPAYLALLHDPRTRNADARRWLLERGYAPSLSAVARHRRRLLAAEAGQRAAERKALALARLAGSDAAPDFAAGTMAMFHHLVFERVCEAAGDPRHFLPPRDGGDAANQDPAAAAAGGVGASRDRERLDTAELLRLSQLVVQCVDLSVKQFRADHARRTQAPPEPAPPEPLTEQQQAARDAALRLRIEEILSGRG